MNSHKVVLFLVASSIITHQSALAQSTITGELTGTVKDTQGVFLGESNIRASGPQGDHTTQTNAQGSYRLEFLPPGLYDLEITKEGYKPVRIKDIDIRLDKRSLANVTLERGQTVEEIVVTGSAIPAIDVSKVSVSSDLTSNLLTKLPIGRSIASSINLAVGVADPGNTMLAGNPSISGASGLENSYLIDGVDITNAGYGSLGSYSIRYGSMGSGVNFDFVETVQVKSAGFEAEYGSALGGVVNVITKRGSNEFHGSVFSYFQPRDLESRRRMVSLIAGNAEVTGFEQWDVGVTLGGPLMRDKLFFFAAINPQQRTSWRRVADPDPNRDGVIDYPLGDKEYKTQISQQAYAGNLTFRITPKHVLDMTAFGDPGHSHYGAQSGADLLVPETTRFSELELGGHNQVIRYNGVVSDWMNVEAYVAHAYNNFSQTFPASNNRQQILDYTQLQDGGTLLRSGGIGFYEKEQKGQTFQYHLKVSHFFEALGDHEVKYGISYEDRRFDSNRDRTGPPLTFRDWDTGELITTQSGARRKIIKADDGTLIHRYDRAIISGSKAETSSDYIAIFLQDQWRPIEDLTLSLGVRAQHQKLKGSALSYSFKMYHSIAPRLGVTWDFTGEGRGKIYGHYGRFFEKIPNDMAVRLFSQEDGITRVDFADLNNDGVYEQLQDGEGPTVSFSPTHYIRVGSEPTQIREGTKNQYQDEVVLGVQYELFEDWNFGARWIHREIGRVLEDFQLSTAEGINTGKEEFGAYVVGNPGPGLNDTCPNTHPNCWTEPFRKYDALEITIEKRFRDGWQVWAWYRLGQLWGNYEGLFRNDNGQSDPNLTSLFDFPNNTSYTNPELRQLGCQPGDQECISKLPATMNGQGLAGFLNTDRTHLIRLAGSFTSDFGLTLGLAAWFQSGTPITALKVHPVYENAGEVPLGKRGLYGRTPWTYALDLHIDYQFRISDGWTAKVLLDIMNVLDSQETNQVIQSYELAPNTLNPDFRVASRYQSPRMIRLGLKMEF